MNRLNKFIAFSSILFAGCAGLENEGAPIQAVSGDLGLEAQPNELPRRAQAYSWSSGALDGASIASSLVGVASLAASHTVSIADAPWLQLEFSDVELGANSYLEITSLLDNATQRLDAATFAQWGERSAYFNGDAVEVRLFVDPADSGVTLDIVEVIVGENPVQAESICGAVDNRVASTEPRVGRIDPIGCTGWIIENGKLLTAGHCLAGSGNDILSFNPPASLPNGTVQFPGPEDQYSINRSSFQFANGGVGNDWGVFSVFNNAQTGVQPIQAQGSFSIRQDRNPSNIRITGFGVDSGTTNQTNQTHVGSNTGSSGNTMRYNADTTGGNSGSPIIDEATGAAVGIHSHGGCGPNGGNNNGTSFFNSALFEAVGDIGPGPGPGPGPGIVCPEGSIDFDSLSLASYSNQNASNGVEVQDNGDILRLTGNTWVRSNQAFNITPSTVVEFLFASSNQGEIHAIGFDADNTLNNNARHFQFYGTQNWTGGGKIELSPRYNGSGDFQAYSIPVGQFYTGSMRLVLTNDKDSGTGNNESRFACVRVVR